MELRGNHSRRAARNGGIAGMLLGAVRRREAERTTRCLDHMLPRGARVLDLGSGRGYVGALLERDAGCVSVGCDVAPGNEALRRFCLFDGRGLPFRSGAFDAALLCFVLHHAEDPAALLREAARVTRGRIFVLEDTPRRWPDRVWGRIHCWSFNRGAGLPWLGRVRAEEEWRGVFRGLGFQVVRAEALRRRDRFPPVARTVFVLEAVEAPFGYTAGRANPSINPIR